jgi:CubicO group peptidase (beta-lactamase class C family)
MFSMNARRLFLIPISLLLVFVSCKQSTVKKAEKVSIDSTAYLAPIPGNLPKKDFDRYFNAIYDFYTNNLVNKGFNGGILVAKKGQVIFEAYHGFFNLKKKDSLTPHSPFHLASVSKTFTAMATLKLVEMRKLTLDDDVKKFFPQFPYDNVSVKLLLSHRSGLPNYIYFMQRLGWNTRQYCSNEDVLSYLIQFKPPITSHAGTHFEYCNTNYALLGLIIEKASGKSYADFLQATFFTPLHMNDTYVFNMSDSAKAMPSYLGKRQQRLNFLDTGFGDKNIYSTPEDLLKWDQAMYTNEIFSKQTLDEAYTPYSNEKPGIRNYGYGWRMNVYPNGRKIIYHNGWWHGSNAVFIRMIQDSATIIVLGNKFNSYIYKSKKMAEIFEPSSIMEDDEKGPTLQGNNYNTETTDSTAPAKKINSTAKTIRVKKITRRKR